MDEKADIRDHLLKEAAHYEVSPYYIAHDERAIGSAPQHQKVQDGYEVVVYGVRAEHGDFDQTLKDLVAACNDVVASASQYANVEIVPSEETFVFNVKKQFEPEAV